MQSPTPRPPLRPMEELQYMSGLCLPEVLEKLVQYVLRERPKTKAELFAAMEHHLLSCYDALTRGASDGAGPPADASLRIRGSSGRFSAATAAQIERGRDGLADLQSDRLDILRDWALPPGLGLLDSVRALDLGDLSAYCFCPVCGRSTSDLEPHLWGEHQRLVSEVPEPGRLTVSGIIKLALVFAHEREQEGCALRRDHVLVQHLYTMETPIYRTINRLLREKQAAALQPWLPFLHFLKESLSCLEPYTGIAYRGIDVAVSPEMYETGRIVTWQGFSSASTTARVAADFLGSGGADSTLFVLHSRAARDIKQQSAIQAEDEVLFCMDSQFRVHGTMQTGYKQLLAQAMGIDMQGITVYELIEVDLLTAAGVVHSFTEEERLGMPQLVQTLTKADTRPFMALDAETRGQDQNPMALALGDVEHFPDVVHLLLAAQARVQGNALLLKMLSSITVLTPPCEAAVLAVVAAAQQLDDCAAGCPNNNSWNKTAAVYPGTAAEVALEKRWVSIAAALLDKGSPCDIGVQLMQAAQADQAELMALLLSRGADINAAAPAQWLPDPKVLPPKNRSRAPGDMSALHETELYRSGHKGLTPLALAVCRNDAEQIRALVAAKADPNALANGGRFGPLHYALAEEPPAQVALLLGLGASPGLVDGAGAAPLAYAALHDAAVVRLLLNAKADVNQRFRWRMEYPYQSPEGAVGTRHNVEDGVTALMVPFQGWRWMFTGAQEIFEALLDHGADPNLRTAVTEPPKGDGEKPPGEPALFKSQSAMDIAIARQATDATVLFASCGATVDVRALLAKLPQMEPETVSRLLPILLAAGDQDAKNEVLVWAAGSGDTARVRAALEAGAAVQCEATVPGFESVSPLLHALLRNSKETVQVLLEAGAQATSPLNALALACCMDDPAAATAALDQGADPNTPCHGCTPLAMATATNSLRTAEVLLDRGADPSAASRLHCPPALLYHRTVGAQLEAPAPPLVLALLQGAPQMARLLAQRGADRTVTWKGVMPLGHVLGLMRDSQELKLLDTAAKEQLEQQIEQQKIKMKQYEDEGHPLISLKWEAAALQQITVELQFRTAVLDAAAAQEPLLDALLEGTDLQLSDKGPGGKPLLYGALHMPEVLQKLLKHGLNVNQANPEDQTTPLIYALRNGLDEAVELLLQGNADPNFTASGAEGPGPSPLMQAAGSRKWAGRLLEQGARIDAVDPEGRTALMHAVEKQEAEVVQLLLERGADIAVVAKSGMTAVGLVTRRAQLGSYGFRGQRDEKLEKLKELLTQHRGVQW